MSAVLRSLWIVILVFIFGLQLVQALPQWDGFWGSTPQLSIGSLVPGATVIEAIMGGIDLSQYRPKYLSIPTAEGAEGPATVLDNTRSPPVFYIHNGQLWQPTNLTSVLRVNVLNVTGIDDSGYVHPAPLKLELSDVPKGVDGTWRWRATKLFFDMGRRSNNGLYFWCGVRGVYTALEGMPAPEGCNFMTLHSFAHRPEKPW